MSTTTRSIVTARPAVTCDVCGRNLLRGEHAAVFRAGGQRRMVCELCAARASHEGWLREGDESAVPSRPSRARRARSVMGWFRQRQSGGQPELTQDDLQPIDDPRLALYDGGDDPELAPQAELEPPLVSDEALPDEIRPDAEPAPEAESHAPIARAARARHSLRFPRAVHAVPSSAGAKATRALEVFNQGEHPRRVAGVARSLGVPLVVSRVPVPGSTVVSIVVAWELCWYRYEVDLAEEEIGARLATQGTELEELDPADRRANAAADEHGELHALSH